jgi:uncharacterized membrane protein YfcA
MMIAMAILFAIAGSIKGFVGVGFPTFLISVAAQFVDPRLIIALVLIPGMFSNLWLAISGGKIVNTIANYFQLAIPLIVMTLIFSRFSVNLDDSIIRITIGIVVILFSVSNYFVRTIKSPSVDASWIQWILGAFCGVLGGLTSLPGTPMVMYLLLKGEQKDDFVSAIAFLLFCSSIPMTIGFYQTGLTSLPLLIISFGLCVPTLIGIWLGSLIRRIFDPQKFHNAILSVFFLLGLNLIRTSI